MFNFPYDSTVVVPFYNYDKPSLNKCVITPLVVDDQGALGGDGDFASLNGR